MLPPLLVFACRLIRDNHRPTTIRPSDNPFALGGVVRDRGLYLLICRVGSYIILPILPGFGFLFAALVLLHEQLPEIFLVSRKSLSLEKKPSLQSRCMRSSRCVR